MVNTDTSKLFVCQLSPQTKLLLCMLYLWGPKHFYFEKIKKNHGEVNDTGETDGVKRTDRYIIVNFEGFIMWQALC